MNIAELTDAQKEEAEILDLIQQWSDAVEAKDPAGIVAAYDPDCVLFDAIPPYRIDGSAAIARVWEQCFPYFPDKFKSVHKDLSITVDGNMAIVHGLHQFEPEPADHPSGQTSMRVTVCYHRIAGKWRVIHEHVSVPFDPMSGKAEFIATS
jgi:uncharacterized protein (TIGR02246 family)